MDGFAHSLAFLVAIDRYANVPSLKTPVSDAEELARVLEQDHCFEAEIIANEAATLQGLRSFLAGLAQQVGKNDRVIFYFAGHGTALPSDEGPKGYILPQDASRSDSDTYLPMIELQETLSNLPCRHMLVLLDCCFAGAFRWGSFRHVVPVAGNLHKERFEWFIYDAAWQAIASAAHDQEAIDVAAGQPLGKRDDAREHSPFAGALIAGLKGAADMAAVNDTGDGVITATELYLFLEQELLPKTADGFRQTPIFWPLQRHDKGQFVFLAPGRELALPDAPHLDADANPWRGLKPYDEKQSHLFFGRDKITEKLVELLASERFVVVTGPSGTGKSSLVKAGLLPRLRDMPLEAIVMRPGTEPFAGLAMALGGGQASINEAILKKSNAQGLASWVGNRTKPREVLLVVDQAEELITMNHDNAVVEGFLNLINHALREEKLRVIFTIRSEFEPQFAQSPLKDRWSRARFLVPPMTQNELRLVIEGPAAVKVMRFEPVTLIDELVNEVIQMPGALPLLSFALSQMYTNYLKRGSDDRAITTIDYESLEGGVTGSLRIRANHVVDDGDDEYQLCARRVLERMVSIEAGEFARRRVPQREFIAPHPIEQDRVDNVLKRLDEAALIVTDAVDNQPIYELSHDALIFGWERLLTWVRNDASLIISLRRLTSDADVWSRSPKLEGGAVSQAVWRNFNTLAKLGRRLVSRVEQVSSQIEGSLWADAARLDALSRLRGAATPGLNKLETEFADASEKRARFNRNVVGTAIAAIILLAVGASAAGLLANSLRISANESRDQAVENEEVARSERDKALKNQSRLLEKEVVSRLSNNDNQTAMLIALEGLPDRKSGDPIQSNRPYLPSLERNLFSAVTGSRELPWVGNDQDIETFSISRDSKFVVTARDEGGFDVWDLAARKTRHVKWEDQGLGDQIRRISVNANGAAVAGIFGMDRDLIGSNVLVWDGTKTRRILSPGEANLSEISPDGTTLVIGNRISAALVSISDEGRSVTWLPGHLDGVNRILFSPDSERFVTQSFRDDTPRLWSKEGVLISELAGQYQGSGDLLFSRSGELVVGASNIPFFGEIRPDTWGKIVLWDGKTGNRLDEIDIKEPVGRILLDSSAKVLFVVLRSGEARRYSMSASRKFSTQYDRISFPREVTSVESLQLSADDTRLAIGMSDGAFVMFNTMTNRVENTYHCAEGVPVSLTFMPTEEILVGCEKASRNIGFQTFSLKQRANEEAVYTVSQMRVDSTNFMSGGKEMLIAAADRTLRIQSIDDHERRQVVNLPSVAESIDYEAGNAYFVVAAGREGMEVRENSASLASVAVFDKDESKSLVPEHTVDAAVISRDGRYAISRLSTGAVKVWEIGSRKLISEVFPLREFNTNIAVLEMGQMAINSNGTMLVIAIHDLGLNQSTLDVHKIADGVLTAAGQVHTEFGQIHVQSGAPLSLHFLSDKDLLSLTQAEAALLTLGPDDTSKMKVSVRASDGRLPIRGDAALSLDRERWYVGLGNEVFIIDAKTEEVIGTLKGHGNNITSVDLSEDGRLLATGAADGTVRTWRLFPTTQDLVDHAKEMALRCLTRTQRRDLFLTGAEPQWCHDMHKWPYDTPP